MQTASTQFHATGRWTTPLPAALDGAQTLVLAFAAPDLAGMAAPLADLAAAFPQAVVMGCSSSGEMAGSAVLDASLSVAVVRFEHTRLRSAEAAVALAADSFQAGASLAEQLSAPDLRAVFVLSDGLSVNGSALVRGLVAGLPKGVVLAGGLAGDGSRFGHTWVLAGAQARSGCARAVGLYGDRLLVGQGCQGGWSAFGPERLITRAEGNQLFELDGQPALDLYKKYLGDLAAGLPGTGLFYPLAVRRQEDASAAVVRTILGMDEASRSLTFAGDVPEGGTARLMRAQNDRLIDSAGLAATQAVAAAGAQGAVLAVSVSCVGRRLVLGERTDEEVEIVQEHMPAGSVHVGFYAYGEISCGTVGGVSDLHNQTMTVTVFGER